LESRAAFALGDQIEVTFRPINQRLIATCSVALSPSL